MTTKMHGVSVKLSASGVTAAGVYGIEYLLSHYAHYTLAAPWTTYLALGVGFAVGWLIPETAKITDGEITIVNTDPATIPVTPTPTKGTITMTNAVTDDNGNLVTAPADLAAPITLTPGQVVVFDGTSYTVNDDGTLAKVAAFTDEAKTAEETTPESVPEEDAVTHNLDGSVTINGVTYGAPVAAPVADPQV